MKEVKRFDTKILVIDDSEKDRTDITKNFMSIGYPYTVAIEYKDPLKTAGKLKPALIVIGYLGERTPAISRLELCRQIRNEDYGKGIAVILTSYIPGSHTIFGTPFREICLGAGADDFFEKKFIINGKADLDVRIQAAIQKYM